MTPFGTMSVGELCDALATRPAHQEVCFDRFHLRPDCIDSYRGYYDHLALGWAADGSMRVDVLRALLLSAVQPGRTFTGWKGGTYRMTLYTPVWADNRGDCSSVQIVAVVDGGWCTYLKTKWDIPDVSGDED
jgi:hypothetical protein